MLVPYVRSCRGKGRPDHDRLSGRVRRVADPPTGLKPGLGGAWMRHTPSVLTVAACGRGAPLSAGLSSMPGNDPHQARAVRPAGQSLLAARGCEPGCVHVLQREVDDVRLDPAEVAVDPGSLGQAPGQGTRVVVVTG